MDSIDYVINLSWQLVEAAKKGDSKRIEYLLKQRFIEPTAWYNNALAFAAMNGHVEAVRTLLNDERIQKSDLGHTLTYAKTTNEIKNMIKDVWIKNKKRD